MYGTSIRITERRSSEFCWMVRPVDEWIAGDHLPATKPNGDSSTWRRIPAIVLHGGDVVRIEGFPDGQEHAPLDYVELHAAPNSN